MFKLANMESKSKHTTSPEQGFKTVLKNGVNGNVALKSHRPLQRSVVTGNNRYSGDGYSGDGYSGTKTPDDAILFTVSEINALASPFL